jgi:hypothetical protein
MPSPHSSASQHQSQVLTRPRAHNPSQRCEVFRSRFGLHQANDERAERPVIVMEQLVDENSGRDAALAHAALMPVGHDGSVQRKDGSSSPPPARVSFLESARGDRCPALEAFLRARARMNSLATSVVRKSMRVRGETNENEVVGVSSAESQHNEIDDVALVLDAPHIDRPAAPFAFDRGPGDEDTGASDTGIALNGRIGLVRHSFTLPSSRGLTGANLTHNQANLPWCPAVVME